MTRNNSNAKATAAAKSPESPKVTTGAVDTRQPEFEREAQQAAVRIRAGAKAKASAKRAAEERASKAGDEPVYKQEDCRIWWNKPVPGGGRKWAVLCNFDAVITADVTVDDGVETTRHFEIRASLGREVCSFTIPAAQFGTMNWVAEKLGAADYVEPTQGTTQRLAVAIRVLSENIVQRHVRANTGWIEHEGQDVFLHAGGALGADGPVTGVVVELPGTLDAFELPDPPDRNQLRKSVTFSLFIRRAMADRVAAALLGAVFRAPLGEADLAVHLAGHTGTGKSELASLAQRHFGKSMHSRALPCAWSSTANYLEATASAAKDVLLTVDDFIPQGTPNERARWDALADRLIRAQGNRSGRGRLNSGGAARKIRPPADWCSAPARRSPLDNRCARAWPWSGCPAKTSSSRCSRCCRGRRRTASTPRRWPATSCGWPAASRRLGTGSEARSPTCGSCSPRSATSAPPT